MPIITPNDGGAGGTFTPPSVEIDDSSPSATFTYTPAIAGAIAIGTTNDGGLADPASLSYLAAAPFDPASVAGLQTWWKADSALGLIKPGKVADGSNIVNVADSHGTNENLYAPTGYGPLFYNSVVNGRPVLRFNGVNSRMQSGGTNTLTSQPETIFMVASVPAGAPLVSLILGNMPLALQLLATGYFSLYAGTAVTDTIDHRGAFHVFTAKVNAGIGTIYVDGIQTATGPCGANYLNTLGMGTDAIVGGATFYAYDFAQSLIYNASLLDADRIAVEQFLKSEYATP